MSLGYPFTRACLLGDGCLGLHRRRFPYLSITHSAEQEDYFRYKASKLSKELGRPVKVNGPHEYLDRRTDNIYYRYNVHVTHKEVLERLYSVLYPGGEKTVSREFLDDLGLEALAILWMDDGGMNKRTNAGLLHLYCDEDQVSIYRDWIIRLSRGQVEPRLYREGNKYRLRVMAKQMPTLNELIGQFILPSLRYKLELTYNSKRMMAARRAMSGPPTLTQAENARLDSMSDEELIQFMISKEFGYTKHGKKSERIARVRRESLLSK